MIFEVSLCLIPKCLASQVTNSCKPIRPVVFPAIAFSFVCEVEIWCRSILRARSKQMLIGELISVVSVIIGIDQICIAIVCLVLPVFSLPDTKLTKNKIQLILICDLAGDGAEVMEALPYVKRQQVAGEFVVQTMLYIGQCLAEFLQRLVVPGIGNDGRLGIDIAADGFGHQVLF